MMKRLLLGLVVAVLCMAWCAPTFAGWQYYSVPVRVTVYPAPIPQVCSQGYTHWVQPAPYTETRYETRQYWVPDPIYVQPYYSAPLYYQTCPGYRTW